MYSTLLLFSPPAHAQEGRTFTLDRPAEVITAPIDQALRSERRIAIAEGGGESFDEDPIIDRLTALGEGDPIAGYREAAWSVGVSMDQEQQEAVYTTQLIVPGRQTFDAWRSGSPGTRTRTAGPRSATATPTCF